MRSSLPKSQFARYLTPPFEDVIDVHQSTTYTSFATSPSINTQPVSLSLRPVETRAARSEVTNLAFLVGELDAIFFSTYAGRTEPFYSTITRSSHLTYLQKNTTSNSCEIHWRSVSVGVQFGRPSLTVAPVAQTPVLAPAPRPSANGRTSLLQLTTSRCES